MVPLLESSTRVKTGGAEEEERKGNPSSRQKQQDIIEGRN
jgi:hypothetical protein